MGRRELLGHRELTDPMYIWLIRQIAVVNIAGMLHDVPPAERWRLIMEKPDER